MANFKYLYELYEKPVDRKFNPAVNASDFKAETVNVEIDEYVFTDEIINNIYHVLSNIRDRQTAHNGIWINGYFGSGKSHFLKFLDYCLHPDYSAKALARFTEAVKEHDPLQHPDSRCDVTVADANSLTEWLSKANVETILFNIGSVANSNTNNQKVFTEVFWHELNRFRGYNTFNLPLAQYLEKALDEKGKFDAFKARLDDKFGWDWSTIAAELANTELDTVLEVAKDVAPSLSTDVIRERIVKNDFPLTVEAFMKELRGFVASKPDNFRFIFFADEISQFIDNRSALLLQLQQIVSDLHEACDGKVWIACTAQQDLSEILGDCHISKTTDDYGKIMGRFQVKVSLKGTNSEYITQKRILEKKGSAAIELEQTFDAIRSNINAQLQLPVGYNVYRTKEEYAAYYPFVPYQFTLMMNIFDAFVSQNFVDKEVKGNERSIIKITHSVAKDTKDQEVGNLISFDQFYNAMFRGSLTTKGQKAIAMANNVIEGYNVNRELAQRVVNVLFMICNMDEQQRRVFPATADHVTSLLMRDVDENKLQLKGDVQNVIEYLIDNNILRRDVLADGHTEFYSFFTEEERRVATSISNQYVDNDFMANMLIDFFKEYLAPQNRESFCSSKFSVGATVKGKSFLTSNADILVDFVIDADGTVHDYIFRNVSNRLAFYMADGFAAEPQLYNRLTWICKVRKYLQSPDGQSTSDARKAALDKFRQMANEEYKEISKSLKALFNAAPVISYNQQLAVAASTKDKARYEEAIQRHLQNVYTYAKIVNGSSVPRTEADLKAKILLPSDKNEYTGANAILSEPENLINNYIKQHGGEANLRDIIRDFEKAPYGWSQEATIFFVNELVRRNLREYTYNNAENPARNIVANNIVRDAQKFMVKASKEISQDVINDFISSWRDIFGDASNPTSSHPADIHNWAKDNLNAIIQNDSREVLAPLGSSSPVAAKIQEAIEQMQQWLNIRDDEQFFRRITTDRESAKELMDQKKQVREFVTNPTYFNAYKDFLSFVNDNRDNWDYLPDTCRADIDGIKAIVTEPWPIDKLRHYKQMKQSLAKALDEVRQSLRKRIEEKLYAQDKEIYGLQDELKPNVPLKDVTILQQGEVSLGGQASLPVQIAETDTRRHLPHRSGNGTLQHITFRLADSLPQSVLSEYKSKKDSWLANHPQPWDESTEKEYHSLFSHRMDEFLDNGYGACVLRQPDIADIMENAIKFHDGRKYNVLAYVIMPNHVHLLVEVLPEYSISSICHSIKSFTANEINKNLGKSGRLWMEESFDREIRNEEHYNNVIRYIWKNFRSVGVRIYDATFEGETCYRDRQGCLSSQLRFNADVVIKQFISYAIGCMMGRYRLDRPGLAIAYPNPSEDEVAEYVVPQTGEKWWIDDDGIVPMMGADSPFHDNAANRFSEFVRVALGNDKHTDNMNFIRECLGKDVVDYLRNDFYADHKRMYQNRPIYWMFSSNQKGKRAAFQCLVYMHRMDRFTPEHIRTNYLLPYIDHLAAREAELMAKPSLTTKESKELKQLRSDLDECRDYQLRLHAFADQQIAIDLDDGVVKNYATFASVLAKLK